MAVSREFKYIYSVPDRREWLFDRINDPHETRNRVALPSCAEAGRGLRLVLQKFLPDCGREFPDREMRHSEFDGAYPTDPDAGLLFQDHEQIPPEFPPGYTP